MANGLTLLLAVTLAALGALIATDLERPARGVPPAPESAVAAEASSAGDPGKAPAFAMPPLADLAAARDHPLFEPTRTPPDSRAVAAEEPATEPIAAVDASPPAIELSAVVLGGPAPAAIIEGPNGAELHRVGVGEMIGDWAIDEILPDRLVLTRGEERAEVALREFGPAPPPRPLAPQRTTAPTPAAPAPGNAQTAGSAAETANAFERLQRERRMQRLRNAQRRLRPLQSVPGG